MFLEARARQPAQAECNSSKHAEFLAGGLATKRDHDAEIVALLEYFINKDVESFVFGRFTHFVQPTFFPSPSQPLSADSVVREIATASPPLPFFQSPGQFRECFFLPQNAFQSQTAAPSAAPSPIEKAARTRQLLRNLLPHLPLFPDCPARAPASSICPLW